VTAAERTPDTGREARRAERFAAAQALLAAPPPLEALAPRRVTVHDGDVVHASRSRPVVRWRVSVETEETEVVTLPVIGKAFHKGGGEDAGRLLSALRDAGFDHPGFAVPRPLGWDPGRRLLAQEEAPPGTLHALLERGALDQPEPAHRVGQWLARLHGVSHVPLPPLPPDFEARTLGSYRPALVEAVPEHADRLDRLVEATVSRLHSVRLPGVLTHGDFQPKNVHLDEQRVVVIDFDRAAVAPASRDLGHFIGQTRTMAASHHGRLDTADGWVGAFLQGYVDAGGTVEAVAAAAPYVGRTYAEVLFYRLVVRPVGRTDFVPGWLDAWERCVSGSDPDL